MRFTLQHRPTGAFLIAMRDATTHLPRLYVTKDPTSPPESAWWLIDSNEYGITFQHARTRTYLGAESAPVIRNPYQPPDTEIPGLFAHALDTRTVWTLPRDWDPARPSPVRLVHRITKSDLRVRTERLDTDRFERTYVRMETRDADEAGEWELVPERQPKPTSHSPDVQSPETCASCSSSSAFSTTVAVILAAIGGYAFWILRMQGRK